MPRFVSEDVFVRLSQGTEAGSFRERVELWKIGLDYWARHPIEEAHGAYMKVTDAGGATSPNVSHNTFITVLVEGGIIGATLIATFWILLFRSVLTRPRREKYFWFTVFAIWLVSSMAITVEYEKFTWLLYGIIMAFCALPIPNSTLRPAVLVRRQPGYR